MYICKPVVDFNSTFSVQMNIIKTILSSQRSVFTMQSLAVISGETDRLALRQSLHYFVKKGEILNPRRGIYAKKGYDEKEMACALLRPSYISLEYVLARTGITFQYNEEITCISYQTRTIEVDNKSYSFRQINPLFWTNMLGIDQQDNIAIATPERAFLDMIYLSLGQCYFDNIRPLNKKLIQQILPAYNSIALTERVNEILKN